MRDLIAELIKRFGVWVILGLFLAGTLVWGIAHFNAKPGEKISILWGMVEYMKGESQPTRLDPSLLPSPDRRYEAMRVVSGNDAHYQVREIGTGHIAMTTHAQYETPNDVKAGLFSPDSRKIAAAYHYGHEGNYTWIGIWDIETGNLVGTERKSGWTTDIYSVFDEKKR